MLILLRHLFTYSSIATRQRLTLEIFICLRETGIPLQQGHVHQKHKHRRSLRRKRASVIDEYSRQIATINSAQEISTLYSVV